jgi:uncharacterized protein (TIGR02266 family)
MAAPLVKEEDLRAHPRRQVEIEITLQSESNFYAGFGQNLSEGGIFVATHALRPKGTRLDVAFTLPGNHRRIEVEGEVRWVRAYSETSDSPPGMGLSFVSLSAEDAQAIRAFSEQRPPIFFDE